MRKLGRLEESRLVNHEAVRRAEKLLELNPSNGRVLSFGAGALQEDGQSERALEWARRAEALYPDDMGVIINGALPARAQLASQPKRSTCSSACSARAGARKTGSRTTRTTTVFAPSRASSR